MTDLKNSSDSSKQLSKSDLKHLENFSNPYVKIILACTVCNKEQSLKYQSTWKRHFLTHASDDNKPFQCTVCNKAFVQSTQLTSHMKRHMQKNQESISNTDSLYIKPENLASVLCDNFMKLEN